MAEGSGGVASASNFVSQDHAPPPIIEESADVEWETTLQRDPYDVEIWLEYAEDKARRGLAPSAIAMVFERALARLPGSYKIWYRYLICRREWIAEIDGAKTQLILDLNSTFERALVYMTKMPRIWLEYCDFLVVQKSLTLARKTYDRALGALPITQHDLIWDAYAKFALSTKELPSSSAEAILRRRVIFDPEEGRAALVQLLKSRGMYKKAAQELVSILKRSQDRKDVDEEARRQMRRELFAMARSHPDDCADAVDWESLIESLPNETSDHRDEKVQLYESLADHLIQLGRFDHAREVFERAIFKECDNVKSLALLFEAYTRFEEAILDEAEKEIDQQEVKFRVKRLRNILDKETRVASEIMLRAWPGDVGERLDLIKLLMARNTQKDAEKIAETAFPDSAPLDLFNGRGSELFLRMASNGGSEYKVRDKILARGCRMCWDLRDVVTLWRARIELALTEGKNPILALQLARECLTPPSQNTSEQPEQSKKRPSPHRSSQLWSMYLDLEEVFGTLESARAAYEQAMEIKVASVLTILNYCKLLRKHDFYEDSFSVFERAIALFPWPHARDLWVEYLRQFVIRYQGTKIERARDLFEQCIESIAESSRHLADFVFFSYAKFEEEYGLTRRAMQVYERWTSYAPDENKADAFFLWGAKCEELLGAPASRKVYEKAIATLPESDIPRICVRFADVERRLGEVERARIILKHGSQFADPLEARKDGGLWTFWNDLEVRYGDEETFKEMLRVKRSVQAHYSVLHVAESARAEIDAAAAQLAQTTKQSVSTLATSTSNGGAEYHVDDGAMVADTNEIDLDD